MTSALPSEFDGYRLIRQLGRGAMGSVYLARDLLLERDVAIKLLHDDSGGDRFRVEARAIARLQHPNVVAVHRVGQAFGRPYLAYELVRGESLDRLPKPVPEPQVLAIALDLARGLSAAHQRGVLHRDVKPANAILGDDGSVKLVDFGLAKIAEPRAAQVARETRPETRPESLASHEAATMPSAGRAEARDQITQEPRAAEPPQEALTATGTVMGTPIYMSPEAWRGEPIDARGDLYSLGALLYELLSGAPPHAGGGDWASLEERVTSTDAQPLSWRAPGVSAELAAIVDRCLSRDPEARFPSADALLSALLAIAPRARPAALPAGNPYRALEPFRAEHRALFFGRDQDIERIVERLRGASMLVVAGDSGIGKSSLIHAGVCPRIEEDVLGEGRRWATIAVEPGKKPVAQLIDALAPWLDLATAPIEPDEVASTPDLFARRIRERLGSRSGLVVIVDQLEELVTMAGPEEAAAAASAIAKLADRLPGVRVVATVRSDFLSRVAALPGLGALMSPAIHLLRPLDARDLRELIVAPAQLYGVRFESEALVGALIDSIGARESRLPLLEFALAELWEHRDRAQGIIRAASLEAIGGASGAVARHADGVIDRLMPGEREAAKRILIRAVTAGGTKARLSDRELGSGEGVIAALEALVRGRLLVARPDEAHRGTTYELVHEALIDGWQTLADWLREDGGKRAAREKLGVATASWTRSDKHEDALLPASALMEIERAGIELGELQAEERELILLSRRRLRRRRVTRIAAGVAVVALPLAGYGGTELAASRARERAVEARLAEASAAQQEAARLSAEADRRRAEALVLFERGSAKGEEIWSEAARISSELHGANARVLRALEAGLAIEPRDPRLRTGLADVLLSEAMLADREHRPDARDALIARLGAYDDGARLAGWSAPAQLEVVVKPLGTRVEVSNVERQADGRRVTGARRELGVTPLETTLSPGSYVLHFPRSDLPIRVGRGEVLRVDFEVPEAIPEGMIFVPPGRFYFGSTEEGSCRASLLAAQPLRTAHTGAFLIGRHEVTFGDWIEFLDALPPADRARHTPKVERDRGAILLEQKRGEWTLSLRPTVETLIAKRGERIVYPGRKINKIGDWLRFPVLGISAEDSEAYARWLDQSGRLRRARLCREDEWERAARGADDRRYPHGDTLSPSDANHDVTYGREPLGFGPDEVGLHPASRSPFGLEDVAGNAWEWTGSIIEGDEVVIRGGGWYEDAPTAMSANRAHAEPGLRDPVIGLRICADP